MRQRSWRRCSAGEQAAIVSRACALVGMHGGGLTNLLFLARRTAALPGGAVLSLAPPLIEVFGPIEVGRVPAERAVFHSLACAAGVPHFFYTAPLSGVSGEGLPEDVRDRPADVDVGELVALVERAILAGATPAAASENQ